MKYIIVFDMGRFVMVMSDEPIYPERGVIYSTREAAEKCLAGHPLAWTAQIVNLDGDDGE